MRLCLRKRRVATLLLVCLMAASWLLLIVYIIKIDRIGQLSHSARGMQETEALLEGMKKRERTNKSESNEKAKKRC